MLTFASNHFEELKSCVLAAAGTKSITPADCKRISILITAKTKQNISETTLKRIYGFALSKFKPSLFTIDVLSRYCDYDGWEDFCEKQENKVEKAPEKNVNWKLLQQNANKITGFTLQALKNKSGIPYNQTIKRNFIDQHFDEFLKSGCTGTLFSAPSGYGKTIGLCHWVDEKLAADAENKSNDIVLLFSSSALMSVLLCGRDINDWMLALLGYSADNDVNILLDVKQRKGGKFYLVIDGFDEYMFKSDQFRVILNQLIDIFSFYQSHDWFKLVLTTRSSTWINNQHEMETGNNTWFTNFKKATDCINVPPFSIYEIKNLSHKLNPLVQSSVSIQVAENFNHPLYFQFYYQQHKGNFSLDNVDYLSIYKLISTFILNKVYLGHYSAEKMIFIKKLVDELDIKNDVFKVNKMAVTSLIKQYNHAYLELLSIGFLREVNESNDYQYDTYITFDNYNFLDHSIAKIFIYNNRNQFDAELINTINYSLAHSPHKVKVLKWCTIHTIRAGHWKNIELLTKAHLTTNEKSEIVIFLGELLENELVERKKDGIIAGYFKHPFSDKLFDYFLGPELINSDHIKTLKTLLKFELSDERKILVYTSLAVIAAVQLDVDEMETNLNVLKSFAPEEYLSFAIDPLNCIEALYDHLKYGIINKEALSKLTHLSFNHFEYAHGLKKSASNDLLNILGLYTILLCNNPAKTIRFVNFLNKNYRNNLLEDNTTHYSFFIKTIAANAYFELGDNDMVSEIYQSICATYKKSDDMLTPYMKVMFHSLKVRTLVNTTKENQIVNEMKSINNITDKWRYKFPKLFLAVVLLKKSALQTSAPEFYKQINFEFIKMMSETGLNATIFLHQNMAVNE